MEEVKLFKKKSPQPHLGSSGLCYTPTTTETAVTIETEKPVAAAKGSKYVKFGLGLILELGLGLGLAFGLSRIGLRS